MENWSFIFFNCCCTSCSTFDAAADEIEFVEGDEELFDENEFEDATFENESSDHSSADLPQNGQ